MGKINLLDSEISNQIAAGEVVERPASVVKELVENAIDAHAKRITVEIRNGGNTYIRVTDDGSGMEKDDAVVAFLRHATSKIKTQEDLDAIYTLGFRGEALSSIGAVSEVDLYTKRREDETGTHTVCTGGEIVSGEDATPDGTTFIVKNLFYNVPARRKFLKKDATEAGYITDIMTRFILSYPEISFKLISNSKEVLSTSGDSKLINCIYSAYGRDYAGSMIEVDYTTEYLKVTGLIGKGNAARPNRNYQSYFVNKRYIKSPLIIRAVEEAYKNQIMIGKFPVAVLNIQINPGLIDINVHPTKLEVKFSNDNEIYHGVYQAVYEALYRIADIPEIIKKQAEKKEEKKSEPLFIRDSVKEQITIKESVKKEENKITPPPLFEKSQNLVKEPKLFASVPEKFANVSRQEIKPPEIINPPVKNKEIQKEAVQAKQDENTQIKQPPKHSEVISDEEIYFKIVGQLFDTYIIVEKDSDMLMIDQHAAHERLNYERLKIRMDEKRVYTQSLLIPCAVSLSANEMATFLQNSDLISQMGFEAEDYGNGSVIIRSIPIDSVDEEIADLFIEILSQLENNKKEILPKKRERLLYTIACKAAVKANAKMSPAEQKDLVLRVLKLENINTCPHGRPICIKMSKTEIEKQFKRIV